MGRLSQRDAARVQDLQAELAVLRDGAPSALSWLPEALRDVLQSEQAAAYRVATADTTLRLDGIFAVGFDVRGYSRALDAYMRANPASWALYDARRPEPSQRNRVLTVVPAGETSLQRDVWPRFGISLCPQLRVLVCEGPSLLAWVGVLQSGGFEAWQGQVLRRIVPALRRRLSTERLLASDAGVLPEAILEEVPGAAFVIGATGEVVHCNAAGRAMIEAHPGDTLGKLRDAVRGVDTDFRLTRVAGVGGRVRFVAVARSDRDQASNRVRKAAVRWGLTARQATVLRLIVEGRARRTIAAILGISEKTLDVHLAALREKAQVDSSSMLVARVWRD